MCTCGYMHTSVYKYKPLSLFWWYVSGSRLTTLDWTTNKGAHLRERLILPLPVVLCLKDGFLL